MLHPRNNGAELRFRDREAHVVSRLHQQLARDNALKSLGTDPLLIEHGRIEIVTHHGDQLTPLCIHRLLQLHRRDGFAIYLGDGTTATAQQNRFNTKKCEGDDDQPDNNLGGRSLSGLADVLKHAVFRSLSTKKRTHECAFP